MFGHIPPRQRLLRRGLATCLLNALTAVPILAQASAGSEAVCRESDNQFQKASTIFAQIATVFRNPRCINCHGGLNQRDHPGSNFEPNECQSCHQPGWTSLAPPQMSFVGKSDQQLCMLLKDNLGSGRLVVGHFLNDNGGNPFIGFAFAGTRALNDTGQDLVLHPPYKPEPITSISRPGFVQLARDWVNALGTGDGEIGGSGDCGCVQHHYGLQIQSNAQITLPLVEWGYNVFGNTLIPLVFGDDQRFVSKTAKVTSNDTGHESVCQSKFEFQGKLLASGEIDASGNDPSKPVMKARIVTTDMAQHATTTCPYNKNSPVLSVLPRRPEFPLVGDTHLPPWTIDFEMPGTVGGQSQVIPYPNGARVPGYAGGFVVTLVQID
jgi:hypothetical protein